MDILSLPHSSKSYFYPLEIASLDNRPLMMLTCNKVRDGLNDTFSIFFPIPASLSFNDSGIYDDANLGFVGNAALQATRGAMGAGAMAGMKAGLGAVTSGIPKSLAGVAQALAANSGLSDSNKSAISIGVGATLNKNITTEFTGVGTRHYNYQIKMIASSQKEAEMMREINKAFRIGLYPSGNSLQLQYPPTWTIRFINGIDGGELDHIPKIFEVYLTEFSAVYNSTANIWRTDGSPLESDITIAFKETRALTAEDIKKLESSSFKPGSFSVSYNTPSTGLTTESDTTAIATNNSSNQPSAVTPAATV